MPEMKTVTISVSFEAASVTIARVECNNNSTSLTSAVGVPWQIRSAQS